MTSGMSNIDFASLGNITSSQTEAVAAGRQSFQQFAQAQQGLAGAYGGETAMVFQTALDHLKVQGDNLFTILDNMSAMVADARGMFQLTDQDNLDMANELRAITSAGNSDLTSGGGVSMPGLPNF